MRNFLLLLFSLLTINSFSQTHDSWIKLDVQLDNWPEETEWLLWHLPPNEDDSIVADRAHGDYDDGELVELFIPLHSGQYRIELFDEYGDGFYPSGYFLITNECQDTLAFVQNQGYENNNDPAFGGDSLALANGWTTPGIIFGGPNTPASFIDTLTIAPCAPPTTFIPGCLDPIAQNYDSLATVHAWGPNEGDSQCEYLIGCMNPLALNYDSLATQDDYELCIFPPCNGFDTSSVSQSCNGNQVELSFMWQTTHGLFCDVNQIHYGYDLTATPFVQSQFFQVGVPIGSTPPTTFPYTIWEVTYLNNNINTFDVKAGGNFVTEDVPHFFFVKFEDNTYSDTLWITPDPCIVGCTDPTAPAYNPFANISNGICGNITTTCPPGQSEILVIVTPDTYAGETSWEVVDTLTDNVIATSPPYNTTGIPVTTPICVDSTTALQFNLFDSFGDGLCGSCYGGVDGEVLIINPSCGDTLFYLGPPNTNFGFEENAFLGNVVPCSTSGPLSGCTDPGFVEYNPMAVIDDGSCSTPVILGCLDSNAFNYDPLANQQLINPSCNYTVRLTDGAGDGWFGSYIGIVQNDSVYGPYTIQNGSQLDINLTLGTIEPAKIYFFTQGNSFTTANQCGVQLINPAGNTTFSVGSNPWTDAIIPYPFNYTTLQDCGNNCIPVIAGCMDSTAFNYNPTVNTDDGSCYYAPGCTSPAYLEYHTQGFVADFDDGSCSILAEFGCTDPTAFNYNSYATVNWTSATDSANPCIPTILGCTDPTAFNFIPLTGNPYIDVNTNDNSCIPVINGCTDSTMWNYNSLANTDNGTCIPFIYGCTDNLAANFNPLANTNDNSCYYNPGCTDNNFIQFYTQGFVADFDDGSCLDSVVYGCTDPTMFNYDSLANIDNGSCVPFVYGCMDVTAFNYDPLANAEYTPSNCIPTILGCTDPTALNYDANANTDDGSCIPILYGCMDSTMFNYNPLANVDNGTCQPFIYGCTDVSASNYDPTANTSDNSCYYAPGCTDPNFIQFWNQGFTADYDDGSCLDSVVYGCMDPSQFNYNPLANLSDNSCIPYIYGCMDTTMFNYDPLANTDNGTCEPFVYGCTDNAASNYNPLANTEDGSCYYAPGCTDPNFIQFWTQGFTADYDNGSCVDSVIYGCMDPTQFNYNPLANLADGSCIPFIYGCMDTTMWNYNPAANTDNGTCIPFIYGCTDPAASNYNPLANTLDGSCYYNPGCTDPLYLQFWTQGFTADYDDGSCVDLAVYGCMNPTSFNYDSLANIDDGSCIGVVLGCMDDGIVIDYDGDGLPALNYNPLANTEDGSCITKVFGCMDPTMFNYDPLANVDNNSCIPFIYGCMDTTMFNYDPLANTQPANSCVPFIYGCMDDGQGNDFNGDGLPALNYDATANTNQVSATDVSDPCVAQVFGCTDSTAFNYDPLANVDNGTCIATVYGCTDEYDFQGYLYTTYPNYLPGFSTVVVDNYDPLANTDDGSCLYYDITTVTGAGNPYWLNDSCYAWVVYEVDPYCLNNSWDAFCQSQYDYCEFGTPLSLDDMVGRDQILVYPNPTRDKVHIKSKNEINVDVYDLLGNHIIHKENAQEIDMSNFSQGIYDLRITFKGMIINHKVIKQ